MGKIDVDRLFIYLWGNTIHFDCIECALKEQGLKIVNGEIVEIDVAEKSGSREYHRVPSMKPTGVLKEMLDELKENKSEDEKIKEAIRYAIGQSTHSDGTLVEGVLSETAITWIQKHGERSLRLKEMLAADRLASAEMTGRLKERKELLDKIGNSHIQKQEWSAGDEQMYSCIRDCIRRTAFVDYDVDKDGRLCGKYADIWNWFKNLKHRASLKLQPHWKPSEEQMYILNWVANIFLNQNSLVEQNVSNKLQTLYNDLKKLM